MTSLSVWVVLPLHSMQPRMTSYGSSDGTVTIPKDTCECSSFLVLYIPISPYPQILQYLSSSPQKLVKSIPSILFISSEITSDTRVSSFLLTLCLLGNHCLEVVP